MDRGIVPSTVFAAVAVCLLAGCSLPTTPLTPINNESAPTPTTTDFSLDAVVSRANQSIDLTQVTAAGYVTGAIEEGGTCTFEFANGTTTTSLTSEGIEDASATSCPEVTVDVDQLGNGSWSVTLDYTGPGGDAHSDSLTVEVL